MQTIRSVAVSLALVAATASLAPAQTPTLELPRVSQHARVSQTIGTTEISVDYHRPGVKGREIWGALVPWDKPWRTGANEATQFTTSGDVKVDGQPLPAGTYALVTIPGAASWTVVFSRQKEMWGAFDYDPKNDQLRVTVTPQSTQPTDWMQFTFEDLAPDAATLALRWEQLRVPVRITADVNAAVLAKAREAIAAAKPDDWRTPYRAASWAYDAGVTGDEAAAWSARALKVKENMSTVALAAKLQARAGRAQDAIRQMTRAIALGKADKDVSAEQVGANQKLLDGWSAEANAVKMKQH